MKRIWIFLVLSLLSPLLDAQNYNAVSTFDGTRRQWDGPTAQAWTENATAAAWTSYFSSVGSPEYCWLADWREDPSGDSYNPPLHTTQMVADAHCVIPLPGWPPELLYTNFASYSIYTCDAGYHWGEDPSHAGSYGCQFGDYEPGQNNGPGAGCDGGEGHDGDGGKSGAGSPSCEQTQGASELGLPQAGDPINTATGNKYIQEDDFTPDPWLTFRRFYNSSPSGISTSMGSRWSHSFNRSLSRYSDGAPTLVVNRPNGVRETFQKTSGATWTTTANNPDLLTETDDSQGHAIGYTLSVAALHHSETYSADGRLLTIQDQTGQVATLAYSDASTDATVAPKPGLLLTVTAPNGRQLSLTYNSDARVRQITEPDGGTLVYTYDSAGNLTFVQYPDGKTRQYLYNEFALSNSGNLPLAMTGIVDENGVRYEDTAFDSLGRATSTQFSAGVGKISITYNADGTSDVTYPLGGGSHQAYTMVQGLARVATLDKPCGECGQPFQTRTYDANSRPATYTDFNGNVTAVTYDANGLMTQKVDAQGKPDQRTIDTTWNTTLRVPLLRTVKDNAGNLVSKEGWDYNASGLTTAACLIDPVAAPSYTCSASGTAPASVRRSLMTYCSLVDTTTCPLLGLLLTVDGPRTDVTDTLSYAYYLTTDESGCATLGGSCHHLGDLKSVADGMGLVTTYISYDKAGRVTRVKDPNGVLTDFTYTPRGWLATTTVRANASGTASALDAITTVTYNADGTVHQVRDADGVTVTYTYDAAHHLTDITDALGNRIHYTLDAGGNRTSEQVQDPTGVVTRSLGRTFNTLGQLMTLSDGLNRTVFSAGFTDSFDGNGNLVHSQDGLSVQRKQVFDGLNRLVSTLKDYQGTNTATANSQSVRTFDALDRVTGFSDPDGLNTTYDIDALGNVTGLHSPDTGTTTRGFDIGGNPTSSVDATNIATTSTFDAVGRLTAITYPDTTLNVAYKFDEADSVTGCTGSAGNGRLTRVIEGSGGIIYCYDQRGNVIKKQQTVGTVTTTTSYTWTLGNRLSSTSTSNGTVVTYARDANGRITTVAATPSGGTATTVASNVIYRPFGSIASYVLGNGQTVTRTYDANGQLTDIASTAFSLHLARDTMGNVTALGDTVRASPATETYVYDPLYRLTNVNSGSGAAIEAYTYNKTGDRLSKTAPGLLAGTYSYQSGTHRLTGVGTTTREVDARGNTTANVLASGAFGYGYNQRNRLTVVQNSGTTVGTYVLNALGQRIQKTAGGVTTRFDYDEASHLLTESVGTTTRDYVWMDDLPVSIVDQDGTVTGINYVYADGLGSPRVVTNGSSATLWQLPYASNPFGENTPVSATSYTLNLRFPGQYFDAESGMAYNIHRDYDAASGRYLQSDPIGITAGPGTYIYSHNTPLVSMDPLGLDDSAAMYNPGFWGRPPPAAPDYYHASIGTYVGTLSLTLTRSGALYIGFGAAYTGAANMVSGKFGGSVTSGLLSGCDHSAAAVDDFVNGASTGASGFYGLGGGISYNSSGSSLETGFGTPGGSYQAVENNVPVLSTGLSW
ncbi:RHS repeat-associated protein [Luteibacter rhizovicinus]|uniref:RHS repeat-associated protein n=1 Tax=Luteibacter rhizovicinus TaxID=242606 RepID=A0A4R3YUB5_9GAMM|nr:RHS repeat-associated core domain-containing protein [Luteibacter rhizovicinus]TCV94944.1 RHS repeat-associated protein [Luteibacter rhizovicinus]